MYVGAFCEWGWMAECKHARKMQKKDVMTLMSKGRNANTSYARKSGRTKNTPARTIFNHNTIALL